MTREDYLLNHDANEGAEKPVSPGTEYHCPHCNTVADEYYEQDGKIIGCEHCIKMRWYYEIEVGKNG